MAEALRTIEILDPRADEVPEERGLAPNFSDLRGRVVGLLENRKHHAEPFLRELQDLLVNVYGVKEVVYATKFSYSARCPQETLDLLTAQCDAIIHGVVD
ncbi:MAG: hypothetical protein BZY88_00290 [SAR202 cluster bacterium Io17-Chloro-G9]|nr:MAG: hypothetical protein BZY88_00290 [SAR202 cluster bacterium Io17-Chloro-G9]